MTDAEKLAAITPILETLLQGPPLDWPGRNDGAAKWEMSAWTARHAADALRVVRS